MKHLLALVLLALAAIVHAAPMPELEIRGLVAQIDAVMDSGLCAVANDTKDYGTEKMTVILRQRNAPPLVRQVLVNDYNVMRSANYQRAPDGRWLMSARAEQACSADRLSDQCVLFTTFFQRFFPSVSPPGPGVRPTPF